MAPPLNPIMQSFPSWMGGTVPPPAQPYTSVPNLTNQITNAYRAKNMATAFNVGANAGKVGAMDALGGAFAGAQRVAGPLSIPMALASAHKAYVPMDKPDANISRTDSFQNIPFGKQIDTRGISFTDPRSGALSVPVKDMNISANMLKAHGPNIWTPDKPQEPPKEELKKEETKVGGGNPPAPAAPLAAMPTAQYDPRAENFVREFHGQADQHLGNAQNQAQQMFDAELRGAGGGGPLAALASYAGAMGAGRNLVNTMTKRGENAAHTAGLGPAAIGEGSTNPAAQFKGELQHWLDENSTLNKAKMEHEKGAGRNNAMQERLHGAQASAWERALQGDKAALATLGHGNKPVTEKVDWGALSMMPPEVIQAEIVRAHRIGDTASAEALATYLKNKKG